MSCGSGNKRGITVEIGKRADMIVIQDDPLIDLKALREVLWTIRDGEARRPADWMTHRVRVDDGEI